MDRRRTLPQFNITGTLLLLLNFFASGALSGTLSKQRTFYQDEAPIFPTESQPISEDSILRDIQNKLTFATLPDNVLIAKSGEEKIISAMAGNSLLDLLIDKTTAQLRDSFMALNITKGCKDDVVKTVEALMTSETWASRMIDASGKLESGLLQGNVYWYGSYGECLETTPSRVDQDDKTVTLFNVHYVLVSIPLSFAPVSLKWGACLPASCKANDVSTTVKDVLALMRFNASIINSVKSSVKEETFPLDSGAIAMISVLSVLLFVLVVATGYDVMVYQPMLEQEQEQLDEAASGNSTINPSPTDAANPNVLGADEYTPLLTPKRNKKNVDTNNINPIGKVLVKISMFSNAKKLLSTPQTSGSVLGCVHGIRFISMTWVMLGHTYFFSLNYIRRLGQLLLTVSLYRNAQSLLQCKQSSSSLACVHGIRFLSLSWVIVGHAFFFLVLSPVRNPTSFLNLIKRPSFQTIMNATVSVDTFFLLSGLLVAYLVMKEMKEKGGPKKINWILFYFHRIWRLTPPYMLVLGAYTTLFKYFGNGPSWPGQVPEPHCHDAWWTNLLYINNVVKPNNGCMMWSWYLANDMQFYIISPIILIPLYLHFGAGMAILSTLMLISWITTGVISAENAFPPSTAAITLYLDKILPYFRTLYMVPWTRIGPYLIGILVGYALYRTDRKVTLKWYTVTAGWALAAGCNLLVLYGLYDVANGTPISNDVSALYNTVHRTMWSCGVGWVIFACVTGYGGPVNKLLSWPALIPFSRLTYVAYLIHPIIMEWFYMSSKITFYVDDATMIYLFFGHIMMSYGLAFILSLAIEAPMMGIEKFIFKR